MKKINSLLLTGLILAGTCISSTAFAQQQKDKTKSQESKHIMVQPSELKWSAAPTSLPPGAQVAVLEGDPSKEGAFTMRIKLPAEYRIEAHWHPADEHITVIQGSFMMGMGDSFDESKLVTLEEGSFAMMPAKTTHFAMSKEESIIQLHGMGPWGINYVNPQLDPRAIGTK